MAQSDAGVEVPGYVDLVAAESAKAAHPVRAAAPDAAGAAAGAAPLVVAVRAAAPDVAGAVAAVAAPLVVAVGAAAPDAAVAVAALLVVAVRPAATGAAVAVAAPLVVALGAAAPDAAGADLADVTAVALDAAAVKVAVGLVAEAASSPSPDQPVAPVPRRRNDQTAPRWLIRARRPTRLIQPETVLLPATLTSDF